MPLGVLFLMGELFVRLFGDLDDQEVDREAPPLIGGVAGRTAPLIVQQYAAQHRTWLGVQAIVGGVATVALVAATAAMFWSGVLMAGWGAVASAAAFIRTVLAAAAWRRARRPGDLVAAARLNAAGFVVWTLLPLVALLMPWPTAGRPFGDVPRAVATALGILIAAGVLWWCASVPTAIFAAVGTLRRVFPGEPTLRVVVPLAAATAGGYLLLALGAFIQAARAVAPVVGGKSSWVYEALASYLGYWVAVWLVTSAVWWVAYSAMITAARRWPVATWVTVVLIGAGAVAGLADAVMTIVYWLWSGAPAGLYPAALVVSAMAVTGLAFGDRAAAAAAADLIIVYAARPAPIGGTFNDI